MRVQDERGVMDGSEFFSCIPSIHAKQLYFYCYEIGHYRLNEDFSLLSHELNNGRRVPFLLCLNAGTLNCNVNGEPVCMKKGDVLFFNTGEIGNLSLRLRIPAGQIADIYWMMPYGSSINSFLEEISKYGPLVDMRKKPTVLDDLVQVYDLHKDYRIKNEGKISLILHHVLTLLMENAANDDDDESETLIENAIRYIDDNYAKSSLSVGEIAGSCCLSRYYFTRLFKIKMGKTPYQYVTDKRLYYAKSMLSMTDTSLSEISEKVGYSDQTVFIRAFSKKFGITPGAYRRELKL